MSSLPMYFPPNFDRDNAVLLNQLVLSAYDMYGQWIQHNKPNANHFDWQPQPAPPGITLHYSDPIWGQDKLFLFFGPEEPIAFVAWTDDGTVYLIFRGTESAADWAENLKVEQKTYHLAPNYGQVHEGFLSIYETMHRAIARVLAQIPQPHKLYVTGHSLGASLATLAVPDIITNTAYAANLPVIHYNLASPRTGSPEFAAAYNANAVMTYRVVNTADLVPTIPLAAVSEDSDVPIYQHVGIPVNFTAQYGSIVNNHSADNAYLYALMHPAQPEQ